MSMSRLASKRGSLQRTSAASVRLSRSLGCRSCFECAPSNLATLGDSRDPCVLLRQAWALPGEPAKAERYFTCRTIATAVLKSAVPRPLGGFMVPLRVSPALGLRTLTSIFCSSGLGVLRSAAMTARRLEVETPTSKWKHRQLPLFGASSENGKLDF